LVIIMIGATVVMWSSGMVAVALMNVIVALLAVFVATPLAASAVPRLIPPVGAPARLESTQ